MPLPDLETLRQLSAWRPDLGVLSVYVHVDPGTRGDGWRIELRNGLREAVRNAEQDGDHELKQGVRATAERVQRHFDEREAPPQRTEIGFAEVGEKGEEHWYSLTFPVRPEVAHDRRAHIHPLLALLDDAAPIGVAVVSAERARLFSWSVDGLESVADTELEAFILDWRERKSQAPSDPARAQGASSSGRDQYGQRLDVQRERYLREMGRLAGEQAGAWREVVVFGPKEHFRSFAEGVADRVGVRHGGPQDLIAEPDGAIRERVDELLPELNREREAADVARVVEEARGGSRGALGLQETAQALAEGRVDHLLFDAERPWSDVADPPGLALPSADGDGDTVIERMVEQALATSAHVTPLEGDAAAPLADADGVGALLRY